MQILSWPFDNNVTSKHRLIKESSFAKSVSKMGLRHERLKLRSPKHWRRDKRLKMSDVENTDEIQEQKGGI